MKKIFGLVGYPVSHSLSPLMHNAAFKALGIDGEYKLFSLKDETELKNFLSTLKENNIFGFNVTVPYKQTILNSGIPIQLSKEAELVGAINVVIRDNDKLRGYNVDGLGFIKHLKTDLNFTPKDKKVALIGAGGGASAVVTQLAQEGVSSILIYDIDKSRALNLTNRLKLNFPNLKDNCIAINNILELNTLTCDLLINATPVGLRETDPALVDKTMINPKGLVYDLIYNPPETKLLKIAKEAGAKVSNGLGMLLYQGVLSFEYFTGKKAPVSVMRKALEEAIKKL